MRRTLADPPDWCGAQPSARVVGTVPEGTICMLRVPSGVAAGVQQQGAKSAAAPLARLRSAARVGRPAGRHSRWAGACGSRDVHIVIVSVHNRHGALRRGTRLLSAGTRRVPGESGGRAPRAAARESLTLSTGSPRSAAGSCSPRLCDWPELARCSTTRRPIQPCGTGIGMRTSADIAGWWSNWLKNS